MTKKNVLYCHFLYCLHCLAEERGARETTRLLQVSAAKVSEVKRGMAKPDEAAAA